VATTKKAASSSRRAGKARASSGAKTSAPSATSKQGASRTSGRRQQQAAAKRAARSALADPISGALREVVGKQKLGADALAAALANGGPRTLRTLRDLIDRALAADLAVELDEDLWGPEPTKGDVARAQAEIDHARDAALRRVLSDALTRENVAARLGISTQAVSKRTSGDRLVALRYGGRSWYPRWQFADDDVIPELGELLHRFPSALSLTTWVTTPFADLDGITPAEMLRRSGGRQRVLELAQATSAEAW